MSFYTIQVKNPKQNVFEVVPDFQVEDGDSDLMIRGRSFYAVWDEELGMWNRNERRVKTIIDKELRKKAADVAKEHPEAVVHTKYMLSYSSGSWDKWKSYISKLPDQFVALDDTLSFADTELKREDYASKRLPYALKPGSHDSYDELMRTLYSQENRDKIEWAIGSILSGDSKEIQKFLVLYGKGGKGKGTVLKIIHKLFQGYDAPFCAKNLSLKDKDFAMEPFSANPMVAIDEDGDLSRIEDATRINSIVSHERMLMNEKGKPQYPYIPHCMLFMATNEPVKIKDAESGIIRRLIDVEPTGTLIEERRYDILMERIGFELGGIAEHCLKRYKALGGKYAYNRYKPKGMMYRTDIFLNFIEDKYEELQAESGITLSNAYLLWNDYCQKSGIEPKSYQRPRFRDELKNYFREFYELTRVDGKLVRSYYTGFIKDCLSMTEEDMPVKAPESDSEGLLLLEQSSPLDELLRDCRAQYASSDGTEKPMMAWDKVTTTLKDLNTKLLHYVLGPDWLIVIDFDLKDENGNKDKKRNLMAAVKWPPTYAEFSKGGAGIHLYYRYSGDLEALKGLYAPDIEVKIYRGKASIRRRLSYCNSLGIATISSGLPVKEQVMVSEQVIKDERYLTNVIRKALRREVPGCEHTKPAVDFIKKVLDDAYASGVNYDVGRLYPAVMAFAMQSHNNKRYCTDLLRTMHFESEKASDPVMNKYAGKFAFFDLEVAPNVNALCWKVAGDDNPVKKVLLPKRGDIEELLQYDIIGFNNRKYDNHILHALRLGYTTQQVYEISKKIILDKSDSGYFREAWDYSKTDILDFSSEKKSLKKFEIEMDIHHQEMNVDWTKDIPEERWPELLEYCANDVIATEKLFYTPERQADWKAREILADIAEMSTNATTNSLSTKIIFQGNKHPQSQFNYRFMGDTSQIDPNFKIPQIDALGLDPEYTKFDSFGRPIFPGYTYDWSKNPDGTNGPKISMYRGEEVGEGGYVYAEPGIHTDVPVDDVESMHPSSLENERLLGIYTDNFSAIKMARVLIKHKNYAEAKKLFNGKLAKYLDNEEQADALSQALKIVINSVYGLTSAKFENPFRDPRNEDNIVAKRGALFMVNLKHEVQRRGFTVAHIKTDSIKIPNATPEILRFVSEYGKLYGYKFDHETTYDRMCLVNDAVYIAKGASFEKCQALYGYIPSKQKKIAGKWTATGKQFQVPYVFKKLFSHEEMDIHDTMETMSVTTGLYLDMNENLSKGDHNYIFVGKCGAFCPILPGRGGGELMRQNGDKYDAASGTKGYRWKEFEVVRTMGLEDDIDVSYYEKQCEKAKEEIGKYGSFDMFVSELPYVKDDDVPWEVTA